MMAVHPQLSCYNLEVILKAHVMLWDEGAETGEESESLIIMQLPKP